MNRSSRKIFVLCLAIVLLSSRAFGQGTSNDYETYQPSEFPQWMHDIRRAEIVLIGSFPIAMLLCSLSYEAFRSAKDAITSAPASQRSEFGSYSTKESGWLIISGISFSGIVALIDFFIDRRDRKSVTQEE